MNPLLLFGRRLVGIWGAFMTLLGLPFTLLALLELFGLIELYKVQGGPLFLILFFFGSILTTGIWLGRWGLNNPEPTQDLTTPTTTSESDQAIRQVLQLARQRRGQISLLEVAADTLLSLEQSQELLEELVVRQIAQARLREDGVIVYEFPEFQMGAGPLPPGSKP
jgi:hypothetical protein